MSWEAFELELRKLPPLVSDPAPWGLNGSNVSVDTGRHGKGTRVRQEGRKKEAEGNARLIAFAPTSYNLLIESLYIMIALSPNETRTQEVAETMGLITDAVAWIHNDPRGGQGLRHALNLPLESPQIEQRPRYKDDPQPRERMSKRRAHGREERMRMDDPPKPLE
jgi:hypothetical protein